MADLAGPGVIDHIWVTIADNEYAWPRLLRLQVYYDGHKTPSVDVPLGDFFASGHGYERDVSSVMVRNSSRRAMDRQSLPWNLPPAIAPADAHTATHDPAYNWNGAQ